MLGAADGSRHMAASGPPPLPTGGGESRGGGQRRGRAPVPMFVTADELEALELSSSPSGVPAAAAAAAVTTPVEGHHVVDLPPPALPPRRAKAGRRAAGAVVAAAAAAPAPAPTLEPEPEPSAGDRASAPTGEAAAAVPVPVPVPPTTAPPQNGRSGRMSKTRSSPAGRAPGRGTPSRSSARRKQHKTMVSVRMASLDGEKQHLHEYDQELRAMMAAHGLPVREQQQLVGEGVLSVEDFGWLCDADFLLSGIDIVQRRQEKLERDQQEANSAHAAALRVQVMALTKRGHPSQARLHTSSQLLRRRRACGHKICARRACVRP
eukprot:COSAG01_NODE_9103_length_2554_cov_1.459063_4_plen_321_part_00